MIKHIRGSHTTISVVYWLEPSREFVDTQLEEMKSLPRFDSPPETLESAWGWGPGFLSGQRCLEKSSFLSPELHVISPSMQLLVLHSQTMTVTAEPAPNPRLVRFALGEVFRVTAFFLLVSSVTTWPALGQLEDVG